MPNYYDAHVYMGTDHRWAQLGLPVPLDADALLQMMDRVGLQGVLAAPPATDPGSDHDAIAQAAKKHPTRVFGVCRMRPRRGKAALEEAKRRVERDGFKAIMVNTSDDDVSLSNRKLIDPVVETATKLKVPVIFDTNDINWPSCTPSMVANVAVDFPETTFVIARMGFGGVNGFPGSPQELLPAMQRASNTVTETGSVFLCKFIQDLIDAVGPERVLMGSNSPYMPLDLPKVMVQKHMNKLTDGQKNMVMGGNMQKVFKIGK